MSPRTRMHYDRWSHDFRPRWSRSRPAITPVSTTCTDIFPRFFSGQPESAEVFRPWPSCISGFPIGAPFGDAPENHINFSTAFSFPDTDIDEQRPHAPLSFLNISQLNVRSIVGKFCHLEQLLLGSRRNTIFCFSETWLQTNSVTNSFLSIPKFSFYRRDRPARNGGGLLVYVPDNLCTVTRRRPDLENEAIECLTFELSLDQNFFVAYRPPDQSMASFFDSMRTLLAAAESESAILTVLGDWNAKHSSWQPDGPGILQEQNSSYFFSISASHSAYSHPLGSHGKEPAAVLLGQAADWERWTWFTISETSTGTKSTKTSWTRLFYKLSKELRTWSAP